MLKTKWHSWYCLDFCSLALLSLKHKILWIMDVANKANSSFSRVLMVDSPCVLGYKWKNISNGLIYAPHFWIKERSPTVWWYLPVLSREAMKSLILPSGTVFLTTPGGSALMLPVVYSGDEKSAEKISWSQWVNISIGQDAIKNNFIKT